MITIGSARINEKGKTTGGLVGDQKQTSIPDRKGEVSMEPFYVHSKGWNVLRPKNQDIAKKIADNMIIACNNPCLGYDQNIENRRGVIYNGVQSIIPCGCDCSSLVRACVKEASGKDPGNFNTDNEISALTKTGLFEKAFPYTSSTMLKRGDILVTKTKGHTAIVTEVKTETAKAATNQNENIEWMWNYFKTCGLNEYAVAGIMGNLYAESHLMSNNLQNTSEKKYGVNDNEYTQLVDNNLYSKEQFANDKAGYGLAQWTSAGRKKGLYEFLKAAGKSIGDFKGQSNYIWKEISSDKTLLNLLKTSSSVREASDVVLHRYERPADQSEKVEATRAGYGMTYYTMFAKTVKVESKPVQTAPKPSSGEFKVKVENQFLNIRKGPGTSYDKTGQYTGVGVFTIVEVKNNFGKLKSGAGWISMDYATRI